MLSDKIVLIVEDSPSTRREIRMILEKSGIQTRDAGGEIGMFNSIEQYGVIVDLIIMDIILKNEDGFDLINKLKGMDKYKEIPILILSQHADKGNVLFARELDVCGFLKKPINPEILISKVKQLLGEDG